MSEIILFMVFAPILGVLLSLLFSPIAKQLTKWVALLSILVAAAAASTLAVFSLSDSWAPVTLGFKDYIKMAGIPSPTLQLTADSLGVFMACVASILGFLIAFFSVEYMEGDKHETKYWIFLQLFVFGMDLLVLASDLILLFVGWEIVGLCSFALIAHYFYKDGEDGRKAGLAGIKAFVFTHLADLGLLFGIILLFNQVGSVDFKTISSSTLPENNLTLVSTALFISAIGKSALYPFTPWLSSPRHVDVDAMQGPTTVSALIHAATMVKAGVYLVSRVYLLLPITSDTVVWTVILVPSITAVLTAFSALAAIDVKRILAYSTVSQLSYMFMALALAIAETGEHSLQAFLSAQFHLVSHAIFKSLLFLTAGYLIHLYHSRDITELSGTASWNRDPIAFFGIVFGCLSLAGIFPFIGFFSKESIITVSAEISGNFALVVFWSAITTAFVTALYCSKLIYYLVFSDSEERGELHSYPAMRVVIAVLSFLVLVGGLFQMILPSFFSEYGDTTLHIDWVESLVILVLLLLTMWVGLIIYDSEILYSTISGNPLVRVFAEMSRQGFYLEAIWKGLWLAALKFAKRVRYIHTGDLNITMFLVALMSLVMTSVIIGGL